MSFVGRGFSRDIMARRKTGH